MRYIYLGAVCIPRSLAAACTMAGAGLLESGTAICVGWLEIILCRWIGKGVVILLERLYQKYLHSERTEKKGAGENEMV